MLTPEIITNALKSVKYPGFSRDIVSFGLVKDVAANDGAVRVLIQLTSSNPQAARQIKADSEQALKAVPQVKLVQGDVQFPANPPTAGAAFPGPQQHKVP